MAAQANLTVIEKKLDAVSGPDKSGWTELQRLHYVLGMWDGVPGSSIKYRELPERKWNPNDSWRSLQGSLSDHPENDTAKMKAKNRALEEEQNARKFGITR